MFSAPLWLFGLLALAIPLLLHLWSRKPRQVIRVGTLRHVDLTADARSWSARLTDPLLLALRLALLITIVFALAGLRLPVRRGAGTNGTLVLVEPALLAHPGPEASPFLDSLAREREPVRLLARGLPRLQLDGSTRLKSDIGPAEELWSALAEADALVGPKGTIHVVARPRIAMIGGTRPRIRAHLIWHVPANSGTEKWTAAGWRNGDSSVVIVGSGTSAGITYSLVREPDVPACDGCRLLPNRSIAVLVDDSLSRARIGAALQAIAQELQQPVELAKAGESADAAIVSMLSDSLLEVGLPLITLSPTAIAGAGVVDSIWAQWPWPPISRDSADPRLVSLNQALASRPVSAPPALGDPEATRKGLLLLALLLFCIERWLATRPGRRET